MSGKLSEKQRNMLNALIMYEGDATGLDLRTLKALIRRKYYDPAAAIVTQEGLIASDIPTIELEVLTLKRDYHYAGGVLPHGTVLTVVRLQPVKGVPHQKFIADVIYRVQGQEPVTLRIYPPRTAVVSSVLVPNMEAVPKEVVDAVRA
jgi:hypothetical protein